MNHIPPLLSVHSGPVSETWGALDTWMKMEVDEENPNRSKRQRSTTSNGGKGQGKGKGRKGQAKMQNI